MNLDVRQDNLYLFIPSKVSWMAEMLSADNNIDIVEAIKTIYLSDTYTQLEDESSKKWHSGPVDLYLDLSDEMKRKGFGNEM